MADRNYEIYVVVGVALVALLVIGLNGLALTGNAVSRTKGACSDNDAKNELGVPGTVTMQHRSGFDPYLDTCLDDGWHLKQYWCARPNRIASNVHFCTNGCDKTVSPGVCK